MVNVRQKTRVAGGRPAVAAVAAGTFSVVTTEMLPVGLLTPIGEDLGVSAGTAGLTMTVPGLVAAVAAPAVTRLAGRLDRRLLLVGLMGLLTVANLLSAAATGIAVLVALRVLVGVCIGGVWAIAAGLAGRLVPERQVGPATSLIFSGIAVASVLGVPAGTVVGAAGGWRAAFLAMGAVALAVTAALAVLLPPLPAPEPAGGTAKALGPLRAAPVRVGLLLVLLLVTGHFAGYTFVRPLLERVPGTDAGLIGGLLVAYGVAGVAGNFLAGSTMTRRPRATLLLIAAALAVVMPALAVAGGGVLGATVLVVLWGLAYGGVSVATQNRLMVSAPPGTGEGVSALFVSVFNLAISLGALVGGRVVDAGSAAGAAWVGGALALLAVGVVGVGRVGR
ncbi:MFS transporter [Streptomyces sp. HU2014]|uniref:Major facilitator superfamily protein n=1 Tax=Streptomyces albireticuli TaxID=1940 RepID=A0A1Z2L0W2_9ACTN|nr:MULTISPECIES: MFS transporter [Streptomyces]ARZ67924.1 major facilitator superfamily protein [Streptomyces albireticuli]UQI47936.1 MFS transporter [Streptomyces sp. HU2014]